MKERASVLIGVLAAAWILYGIFAPPSPRPPTARPLSIEAGPQGLLGLWRWLDQAGIPLESLRKPYTTLLSNSQDQSTTGHILITVMPQLVHPGRIELNALLDWVSHGNTVLILAALNDTPAWSYAGDAAYFHHDFRYLTNITPTLRTDDSEDKPAVSTAANIFKPLPEPLEHLITTARRHWLTAGVDTLGARSDLPTGTWDLGVDPSEPALVLAHTRTEATDAGSIPDTAATTADIDALMIAPVGAGVMVVSSYGSLLQNSMIGTHGNRRLVINLLRHHLKPGGRVIFDDVHQGLSAVYDASTFFKDPRLWRSVSLLFGFWLLYAVFADSRLGQLRKPATTEGQLDFVRALGGFLARKVSPHDAGLRLVSNFLKQVEPRLPAGDNTDLWDRVGAAPRMNASIALELRADHENLKAGKAVDLEELQRRLSIARSAFS